MNWNLVKAAVLAGLMLGVFGCGDNGTEIVVVPYPAEPAGIDNVMPADPVMANEVHARERWRNPILIVHSDGFELVGSMTSHPGAYLSVEQLEKALNDLPLAAWPWGRTVEVQQDGSGAEQAANAIALKTMLNVHHVLVFW